MPDHVEVPVPEEAYEAAYEATPKPVTAWADLPPSDVYRQLHERRIDAAAPFIAAKAVEAILNPESCPTCRGGGEWQGDLPCPTCNPGGQRGRREAVLRREAVQQERKRLREALRQLRSSVEAMARTSCELQEEQAGGRENASCVGPPPEFDTALAEIDSLLDQEGDGDA